MSSHIHLATLFSVVALSTGTASAQPAPKDPPINPCDPAWQQARYVPPPVGTTPGSRDLELFEHRLAKGETQWIGNASTPRVPRGAMWDPNDHRAIVKVDIHPADGKSQCFDDPHAWYLAVIPMGSRDALKAIDDYYRVEPILPHVLGYCYPASQVVKDCAAAGQKVASDDQQAKEPSGKDLDAQQRLAAEHQRIVEELRKLDVDIRKRQSERTRLEGERKDAAARRRSATSNAQRTAAEEDLARLEKQLQSLGADLRGHEDKRNQLQKDLQRYEAEQRQLAAPGGVSPSQSKACSGHVFVFRGLPVYGKPTHEVVTYDPKCVCNSVDGVIEIVSP